MCVCILESMWFSSWQDTEHSAPPYQKPGTKRSPSPEKNQHLACVCVCVNGSLLHCYDLVYFLHLLLTVPLSTNPLFILYFKALDIFKTSLFQSHRRSDQWEKLILNHNSKTSLMMTVCQEMSFIYTGSCGKIFIIFITDSKKQHQPY